jgi:2-hydroxy-3-keto-5-methylthiopentenyl-1-phosphate phosphatase
MLRIFCDFDGTVCPSDVGENFFRTFAPDDAQRIVEKYFRGEISGLELLRQECAAATGVTSESVDRFVDGFEIDAHFVPFVLFCESHGFPVTVVSDGLEHYVRRLLDKAGLMRIPAFANRLVFQGSDGCAVEFPYTDAECDRCGHCKRNRMLTTSADEDIIVYAGDGFSDRCPVRFADVIFARRQLIPFCQEQNISYHDFRHFGDVKDRLAEIISRKRIRHRREAVMARREVFTQE